MLVLIIFVFFFQKDFLFVVLIFCVLFAFFRPFSASSLSLLLCAGIFYSCPQPKRREIKLLTFSLGVCMGPIFCTWVGLGPGLKYLGWAWVGPKWNPGGSDPIRPRWVKKMAPKQQRLSKFHLVPSKIRGLKLCF